MYVYNKDHFAERHSAWLLKKNTLFPYIAYNMTYNIIIIIVDDLNRKKKLNVTFQARMQ